MPLPVWRSGIPAPGHSSSPEAFRDGGSLDAFSERLEPEDLSELYECRDEGKGFRRVVECGNERAINFRVSTGNCWR